ncbi:MAG: hypothetical protein AB3N14_19365 [Flavobacteriaceae bacterium]
MKPIIYFTTLLFSISVTAQATLSLSDFQVLDNTEWKGTLTYINYSDGQEVSLRTTMQVTLKGGQIVMQINYTDEPSANSTSKIAIRKGGRYFGTEEVIEKIYLENGLKFVTRYEGSDNNKKATMFKTYTFNTNTLSIAKKVVYKKSEESLIRNKYSYVKI